MKKEWRIVFLGLAALLSAFFAYADTVTVSTYYPSPYGSYKDLEVNNDLTVEGMLTAQDMKVQKTLTVDTLRGGSYGFGGTYIVDVDGCQTPNPFTGECKCPAGFLGQVAAVGGVNLYVCYR